MAGGLSSSNFPERVPKANMITRSAANASFLIFMAAPPCQGRFADSGPLQWFTGEKPE